MEGNQLSGSHFPPGFRFHPTDQELINHYLKRKISSCLPPAWDIMAEIDLYKFNPWELPEKAYFGDKEWFFFSPRDRKYPNGVRPNRAAGAGYWKATGTDKPILAADGFQCIGVKKALVFYNGRPPKGAKTDWVMHEYRLLESSLPIRPKKLKDSMRLDDWVLCRVKQKSPLPEYDEGSLTLKPSLPVMNLNESGSFYEPIETEAFLNGSEMSKGGDSDSWSETMGSEYGEIFDTRQQSPPLTVNNSLKRKSFFSSAMEELMQLQPSKRLQCSTDEQYLLQPDFFSLDQDSMEFLTC